MIERIRPRSAAAPRVALFDFDGTLSLIRTGWQKLLGAVMCELLAPLAHDETPAQLDRRIAQVIVQLTGQSIITQMIWLRDEVARLGGQPEGPEEYKQHYLARLRALIATRRERLRTGELPADALLVPGARALLDELRDRGVPLMLASGTDLADVLDEAHALGIADYFGPHIYGPGPHAPDFSKRAVIADLLAEGHIAGPDLVSFGDGPVETAETRAVGGLAVGVAFDEAGGGLDLHKRAHLIESGADLIVVDFQKRARLLACIWPSAALGPQAAMPRIGQPLATR